jgi:hypothetical protein
VSPFGEVHIEDQGISSSSFRNSVFSRVENRGTRAKDIGMEDIFIFNIG